MLEARNISYVVGSKTLLSEVSAELAAGKLHLIVGPNGAGKSTFVKVLSPLLRPSSGKVLYGQVDVLRTSESELAKRRAVLSQAVEVAFPLLVREVVMMGRYPHFTGRPGPNDHHIVKEMMDLFEVEEFSDRNYQTLSGGERQRVNFARVLAQVWSKGEADNDQTRYLFLDEPLTFLDISHQMAFMKMVKVFAARRDIVVVGVVHDLNLAVRFADQIVVMKGGTVIESGAPGRVLTVKLIRDVFDVECSFIPTSSGTHLALG
jgi:iron complex transport system ATP-binding protein